jgi:hypothetical protein
VSSNIHITLREGDRLPITGEEVLVRLGVWDPNRIREGHDPQKMQAYEHALADNPELLVAVNARYGPSFAVLSVYHRPGPPEARPGTGNVDLDSWFGSHPMAARYRTYMEALSGALDAAGFMLLPTDDEIVARVYTCFESAGTDLTNPFRRKHRR